MVAGTQLTQALRKLAEDMGVGLGNAIEKITAGNFRGGITEFTKGISLSGKTSDQLGKLLETAGLTYSIQDGQLQLLGPNDTLKGQVVVLQQGTGLIGSPEIGEAGIVKARSLLQGTLMPGIKVNIKAKEVEGFFRIERSGFTGDTWGNDWYVDFEAKPL